MPGNKEGVLWFVPFWVLAEVLVLVCGCLYFSLNIVDSGKKRKPENCHLPGRDSRHPDFSILRWTSCRAVEIYQGPYLKIGLVYKARIYDSDTKTPNKQKERLGRRVNLRTSFGGLGDSLGFNIQQAFMLQARIRWIKTQRAPREYCGTVSAVRPEHGRSLKHEKQD